MHMLKMPVTFIYHKKKLKSVGLAAFEKQLGIALELLDTISSLEPEVRYYLLYCMDHLGASMRIYDFNPIPGFLDLEGSLKLLLVSLQAFHHQFGAGAREGLISFRPMSQIIERRHGAIQSMLKDLPFPEHCFSDDPLRLPSQSYGRLHIQVSDRGQAIRIGYLDAVRFDLMSRELTDLWSHDELTRHRERIIDDLRKKLPYDTRDLEDDLRKVCEEQARRINDRVLKSFQESLNQARCFGELSGIHEEITEKRRQVSFSEDQQFLLREMFEFHRSRLRDRYLDSIYRKISAVRTREALMAYWDELKFELFSYRSYVGKEYESLIAQFIDDQLESMEE
jgi:hypothetical protein